jgi:hypothetical protein
MDSDIFLERLGQFNYGVKWRESMAEPMTASVINTNDLSTSYCTKKKHYIHSPHMYQFNRK